ncbi:MAG TPA: hypothetical protein VK453_14780 [Micromonosporaceae bacterium]|nr:hypothetical protein [Micromonosporaceae bacterium]
MTIDKSAEEGLTTARDLDLTFSALAKTFGPTARVSDPAESAAESVDDSTLAQWRHLASPGCAHDMLSYTGDPDDSCIRCGLAYKDWTER